MSRWVLAKAWLGGAALGIGLAGMALEIRWLVWIAGGLLAAAFLLRFAGKSRERSV